MTDGTAPGRPIERTITFAVSDRLNAVSFPLVAGILAGVGYLLTLSAHYSSDGMAFARLLRDGDLTAPLFFQAEHLAYPFVGWLTLMSARSLGANLDPLTVLQVLNAFGGGIAIGAFCWTARRLISDSRIVAAMTIALGASYGWWHHASDAEDQIIANAGILLSFAALVTGSGPVWTRWRPTGRGLVIAAGLGVAVLVHATAVLFAPVLVIMLINRHPWRDLIRLALLLGLIVLIPYLVVGIGLRGYNSVEAWRSWLLAAPGQGVWGRVSPRNLWAGAQSLTAAMVFLPEPPTLRQLRAGSVEAWFAGGMVAAMAVAAALAIVAGLRLRNRLGSALLLWLTTVVVFGTYWAPDDPQFWLMALPAIVLLAALAPSVLGAAGQRFRGRLEDPARDGTRPSANESAGPAFLFPALALALLSWNLAAGILPRHDPARNLGLSAALCLGERLKSADLVVAPGWDWAGDYLPYFTTIPVLSLNDTWVLAAKGDRTTFFSTIDQRFAETRRAGGSTYLVRLDRLDDDERAFFQRVTGLGPGDFTWQRTPAFTCGTEPVSEILS